MVIEGVLPTDHNGYMVLDDFSLTTYCEYSLDQTLPGMNNMSSTQVPPICPPGQLACGNGNCYDPLEACNFVDDCGDGTDEKDCSKYILLCV